MSGTVAKIAKPMLRGHLVKNIKKEIIGSLIFATVNALLWKHFVIDARKQAYKDFYATYDPDKDFERMRRAGIFHSVPSGEVINIEDMKKF